jgi:hypothetical protein
MMAAETLLITQQINKVKVLERGEGVIGQN